MSAFQATTNVVRRFDIVTLQMGWEANRKLRHWPIHAYMASEVRIVRRNWMSQISDGSPTLTEKMLLLIWTIEEPAFFNLHIHLQFDRLLTRIGHCKLSAHLHRIGCSDHPPLRPVSSLGIVAHYLKHCIKYKYQRLALAGTRQNSPSRHC